MREPMLPPGLVLWPSRPHDRQRIAVLISDIHCTDGTVGDQTTDNLDWHNWFRELSGTLGRIAQKDGEIILLLNGDVVDLIRSGLWAQHGVYPWQRQDPRFPEIVISIMQGIVAKHASRSGKHNTGGFFVSLQETVQELRGMVSEVHVIPLLGNHDKELQVVPEARKMYYESCLGIGSFELRYRHWAADQLGTEHAEAVPLIPFYFADPGLRLFVTHGQWRDDTNCRKTALWYPSLGWQPLQWQLERYQPFIQPCFGDTIAAGLLSHFIWNATQALSQQGHSPARKRIEHVLREMDLYRPTASAIGRLLAEAQKLDRRDKDACRVYDAILDQFRLSLRAWLSHPMTSDTAPPRFKLGLVLLSWATRLHWRWLYSLLLWRFAKLSSAKATTNFSLLPAFRPAYRALGFRLHVEGHTHQPSETDVRYSPPDELRNYTYINLGAWRDRIVKKYFGSSYRRRSVGRALMVLQHGRGQDFQYAVRDVTRWGDRLDRW